MRVTGHLDMNYEVEGRKVLSFESEWWDRVTISRSQNDA